MNAAGNKQVKKIGGIAKEKTIADDEFMAAAIGDVEWLRQSVRHAKQISFDQNGLAAIHLAALHGRLECLKLLVEKCKQDVNLPSSTGWRPVHLAVSNQTGKRAYTCLQYLLSKGADHSCTNDDGVTPVHQAASEGHVQCLKLLIEVGATINSKDYRGHTPLDLAKLWGHRQCARILATEQWHQEKDDVAREIKRLQRRRIIQELRDYENMPEDRTKELYGKEAYDDWLHTMSLNRTHKHTSNDSAWPAGTKTGADTSPTKQTERMPAIKGSNSSRLQSKDSPAPGAAVLLPARQQPIQSEAGKQRASSISPNRQLTTISSNAEAEAYAELASAQESRAQPQIDFRKWNFSPKIPSKDYVLNTKDCYPRDFYTCMPTDDATPPYLATQRFVPVSAFTDPEVAAHERPVMFRCKNIIDVPQKKKYDADEQPAKPQVILHISSDMGSLLFRESLIKRKHVPRGQESITAT